MSDLPFDTATTTTKTALLLSSVEHLATTNSLLPVLGSSLIMLTIVALLYLWEVSVEWVRESVPKPVRESVPKPIIPVVESILAEISGLGFIGLVLQTFLGSSIAKESLEDLSLFFLRESELLVENFEYLHSAFFQVGVGFFLAAGVMVAVGLNKLQEIETVEGLQVDSTTGACSVTAKTLSQYIGTTTKNHSASKQDTTGTIQTTNESDTNKLIMLWQEIFMGKEERTGKSLLLRNQFMKLFSNDLPETFRIEPIIQASFANNLYKMVELSPLTWIYLIPALALANSIDLSHDVVNASSPNALESAGYFYSTLVAIGPSTFTVILSTLWGLWNCWKLTQIKYMLLPQLGYQENNTSDENGNTGASVDTGSGQAALEILPAPFENDKTRQAFNSSPSWVQPIEQFWSKPSQSTFDDLFGTAGAGGLKLYRNSIKYQTWLCLTHVVFFGTQIVPRDIYALYWSSSLTAATTATSVAMIGDPTHVTAELWTYGSFVLISFLQLALITPRAFWNFCLVECVEEKTAKSLLETVSKI